MRKAATKKSLRDNSEYVGTSAGKASWEGRLPNGLQRMSKCNAEKSLVPLNSMVADSWEKSSQKVKCNYASRGHWRHSRMRSVICGWHMLGRGGPHVGAGGVRARRMRVFLRDRSGLRKVELFLTAPLTTGLGNEGLCHA